MTDNKENRSLDGTTILGRSQVYAGKSDTQYSRIKKMPLAPANSAEVLTQNTRASRITFLKQTMRSPLEEQRNHSKKAKVALQKSVDSPVAALSKADASALKITFSEPPQKLSS
jgi:hypothetical protein